MIILVNGLLGTGKTLFLVYLATIEKKLKIYSNFTLKVGNAKRITPYDLEEINKGLMLLDEFYAWAESRTSGKEANRYLTNRIGFNSRKRELTIVISAQLNSSIDLRFRELADVKVTALGFNPEEEGFIYEIKNRKTKTRMILPFVKAEKLFPLYETLEPETDSLPTIYEPIRLNEFINKFIEILLNEYGTKAYSLSKGMMNDILIEKSKKGLPSRKLIDMVYFRLRRKKLEIENE